MAQTDLRRLRPILRAAEESLELLELLESLLASLAAPSLAASVVAAEKTKTFRSSRAPDEGEVWFRVQKGSSMFFLVRFGFIPEPGNYLSPPSVYKTAQETHQGCQDSLWLNFRPSRPDRSTE